MICVWFLVICFFWVMGFFFIFYLILFWGNLFKKWFCEGLISLLNWWCFLYMINVSLCCVWVILMYIKWCFFLIFFLLILVWCGKMFFLVLIKYMYGNFKFFEVCSVISCIVLLLLFFLLCFIMLCRVKCCIIFFRVFFCWLGLLFFKLVMIYE